MACPSCGGRLKQQANGFACVSCGLECPTFGFGQHGLHWMFDKPHEALLQWKARLNGFLANNASEQRRLNKALMDPTLSELGQRRIRRKLHAAEIHKAQILDLVQPLGFDDLEFDHADARSLARSKLPQSQGLTGYYTNVMRDWVWNNGENERLLANVEQMLADQPSPSQLLTLGAGSGRLSYDLHRTLNPAWSMALDLNPLLLLLAARVIGGEAVPLVEFPVAPLDEDVIHQECVAPQALEGNLDSNFVVVAGDGINPPFQEQSFDAVVTPWFIDIVPHDLKTIARTVNSVLETGGIWINTGSLAFFHHDERWRYSEAEVIELINDSGFEVIRTQRDKQPYLQSPHSAHGRVEQVFSFAAIKRQHRSKERRSHFLPDWLQDTSQSVPNDAEYVFSSSTHLLQAQVLSAIDGKRSLEEISTLVARQYGLDQAEALRAVHRILLEHYEKKSVESFAEREA